MYVIKLLYMSTEIDVLSNISCTYLGSINIMVMIGGNLVKKNKVTLCLTYGVDSAVG